MKMTDTAIQAATRKSASEGVRFDLADETLPGLRLRFTPAGTRSWVLAGRDNEGRMRRFPIGRYPAVGIAQARQAARAMRERVRAGADPVAEAKHKRMTAQDARRGIGTTAALIEAYGRQHGARLRNWDDRVKRMRLVFAPLLDRPLAGLRRRDFQAAADDWRSAQTARGAVNYARPILKWAAQRDLCLPDLAVIVAPASVRRRDRVLSRDELAALLPALRATGNPYAQAALMMLLCATRSGETCSAVWKDFDLAAAMWSIPASTTKNGVPHTVPLSTQAVALLRFIGPCGPADLVFTAGTAPLGNWTRGAAALKRASGTEGWTRHDLRRTAATMMAQQGALPHVIESALGHVALHSRLASIYNAHRYGAEVRAALQGLADALDGIKRCAKEP